MFIFYFLFVYIKYKLSGYEKVEELSFNKIYIKNNIELSEKHYTYLKKKNSITTGELNFH